MREKIKSSSNEKPRRRKKSRRLFKLPPDVVASIKKEFPEVKNINKLINSIFDKILRKVIRDGACTITRFGYFFGYKSFSNRIGQVLPRIKFSISRTLRLDIQDDQYLMDQMQEYSYLEDKDRVVMVRNGEHENGGRELRQMAEKRRNSAQKSKEYSVQDEISSILEESFDD